MEEQPLALDLRPRDRCPRPARARRYYRRDVVEWGDRDEQGLLVVGPSLLVRQQRTLLLLFCATFVFDCLLRSSVLCIPCQRVHSVSDLCLSVCLSVLVVSWASSRSMSSQVAPIYLNCHPIIPARHLESCFTWKRTCLRG